MKHKLIVKNFGPIKDISMEVSDFIVLTGAQSSGKSTIAKLIFFFRGIKDAVYSIHDDERLVQYRTDDGIKMLLSIYFSLLFDDALSEDDTQLEYHYSNDCFAKVTTH
ncbi:MAG: AAA family ATPase, partial [Deferribacteraceae bacterium]|nr:AAA family ATPase [Deferribacteraceae bacterium]